MVSCSSDEDTYLFIGDSLVEGWDINYFFPSQIVYNEGIGGATINKINELGLSVNNKTCVLLIGTNDISGVPTNQLPLSEEARKTIVLDYLNLIDSYKDANKIIAISILPRSSRVVNESIMLINEELKSELLTRSNVLFLDVFEKYIYKGEQNGSYFPDKLHLNYYGYEILTTEVHKLL